MPDSQCLKFPLKGAVENGGQQRVEFGGGFDLQALQRIDFSLQGIQFGDDVALLNEKRHGDSNLFDSADAQRAQSTGSSALGLDGFLAGWII